MKRLILLTLLLCANFIYSQSNETKSKVTSFVIESNNPVNGEKSSDFLNEMIRTTQ